jgi:hypothetical protein
VFSLYYERRHNVVMTRITGVLSSEDIEQHDRAVLMFLAGLFASEPKVRGLYDFSAVEAVAVPVSKTHQRGQRPAIIEGQRVVVAPPGAAGAEWAALIAEQQRAAGLREPTIVATLEEAYRLLGLENPQFDLADAAL